MKRDMDVIRELLLKLEALTLPVNNPTILGGADGRVAIEGRQAEEILQHLFWLQEAGFLNPPANPNSRRQAIQFESLTWAGSDFLDSIRDAETWAKTKKAAAGAGGFTVDLLKDLAKGFIKKQIEDRTGLKL
jgi:Hypothetical protein (DUF2513)